MVLMKAFSMSLVTFSTDCFQIFLDLAAAKFADSIIVMQVDQAACHRAKKLCLLKNIILIF